MRRYQIATAAVIMLIAAVAMIDSRGDALPEAVERSPGGLGPGFYPFWAAALIFVSGAAVIVRNALSAKTGEPPFESRTQFTDVLKVIVPSLVAAIAIIPLGFYLVAAAYMAFFMWYIGHYRPWIGAPVGIALAFAFYFAFERGFLVTLPKSFLYTSGFPF